MPTAAIALIVEPGSTPSSVMTTLDMASIACRYPEAADYRVDWLASAAAGMAPLAYLQALRVEQAKELLEGTRLSVDQIVEKVGYRDVSAFRRLFTRRAGLSPAQYRKRFIKPGAGLTWSRDDATQPRQTP